MKLKPNLRKPYSIKELNMGMNNMKNDNAVVNDGNDNVYTEQINYFGKASRIRILLH